ncbi:diphthine synthase [Candidatus Woesearchaeota archaeon]|nr:diphthine synthase [Candidatus Woesearchaeota archaeon]
MTLYMIGLGLHDENDITLKGLQIVRGAAKVYLEAYTSVLRCSKEDLEKLYGKNVEIADREFVEKTPDEMLELAESSDVAFLVVGDPMTATTHTDLMLRAAKKGVKVEIVHNAGVITAVGAVGLELYKYGKTTSIVFPEKDWDVQTHYDAVRDNLKMGLHTLCLLDIKMERAESHRFMTVNQAIQSLLDIEKKRGEGVFTDDTLCVGCARLGSPDQTIIAGKAHDLLGKEFGEPLHCLIVPGKLHFIEEEALELWK